LADIEWIESAGPAMGRELKSVGMVVVFALVLVFVLETMAGSD
jgi:hypothetical protein